MNLVHDQRLDGTIPEIIEQSKSVMPPLIRALTRLGISGRFEQIAEYPEAAWLEAIVNALAHRSYALHGDHIRVRFFDDRLEVESPGRLPGLVRPDNIRTTRYSRNPRIARVLAEMGYMRELGEGVDRMFDEMSAFGLPSPEFRQGAASVLVTLRNNLQVRQQQLILDTVPETLLPIVEKLFERGRVTTGEVSNLIGVSRPTARRYMAQLRELGWIVQVAWSRSDPTAYWRLSTEAVLPDE